ncbi:12698_t:CDS:1, partial [Funneliformis caledonium]
FLNDEIEANTSEFEAFRVSDYSDEEEDNSNNEEEENGKEMTTLDWGACINHWIEMVNDELYEDEINIKNRSIDRNIHLAEDSKAK